LKAMISVSKSGDVYHVQGRRKLSVFVLALENDTYYVGRTSEQTFTFEDLVRSSIAPAAKHWISLHRPVKIYIIYPNCTSYDEDKYVKTYMGHFGIDNVRGGSYTAPILDPLLRRLVQHELDYVDDIKRSQSKSSVVGSLLISSALGRSNAALTNSVLANSVLAGSAYHVDEKQTPKHKDQEPTFAEWIYDTVYDTGSNILVTIRDIGYMIPSVFTWK